MESVVMYSSCQARRDGGNHPNRATLMVYHDVFLPIEIESVDILQAFCNADEGKENDGSNDAENDIGSDEKQCW